jgi:hypothetical protein
MNNFNNIFLAIKKHCDKDGVLKAPDCFETIAKEVGVPVAKIDFFLNTLQELQLIKYSVSDHYIKLTSFGRKQERLFTDN